VRVELDAESAALALGDVDGMALAAADLVEDGLSREAGLGGGVGEADVTGGDVGDGRRTYRRSARSAGRRPGTGWSAPSRAPRCGTSRSTTSPPC
jgi:hypothetical protein